MWEREGERERERGRERESAKLLWERYHVHYLTSKERERDPGQERNQPVSV